LEQIYKTIRRIRSEQKRTGTVYEDNLKKVEDRITQLEKNITNQFKQQQIRDQLNKREESASKTVKEPKGLLGKVLANPQQIQFGVVLFLMFWIWLSMRSMSSQINSMSFAK
jgi:TolA-binding protein